MKTKIKYLTFNNQEFNSAKEVEEYERTHYDTKIKYDFIWKANKIFPTTHKEDTQEKEHCVITGKLCNIYEVEEPHHNGDYYRGKLKEKVNSSVKIYDRWMNKEIAEKFLIELEKLIKKLE